MRQSPPPSRRRSGSFGCERVRSRSPRRPRSPREKLERSLDEPTKIDFTDVNLPDAAAFLTDYHHIQIQIDRKVLEAASLGIDTPMTMQVEGVTLRSCSICCCGRWNWLA